MNWKAEERDRLQSLFYDPINYNDIPVPASTIIGPGAWFVLPPFGGLTFVLFHELATAPGLATQRVSWNQKMVSA
ncbi:hypothetical protein [Salinicola peritrichatus]|uniref:hypothetical protein n=1 Tax=Salinicola peritrichatus TaxID=1267424 RepID=UPI000DA1444B|nr:hypothetical protein [Salinicola peritrichatus]